MMYRFDGNFLIISVQVHQPTVFDEGYQEVKIPRDEFRQWLDEGHPIVGK